MGKLKLCNKANASSSFFAVVFTIISIPQISETDS
jgi:hypothetical protein